MMLAQLLSPCAVEAPAPDRSHAMPETGSEPTFSSLIADDDGPSHHARLAQRSPVGARRWWIALIALAVAGTAIVYWWRQQQAPSLPPAPLATEAPPSKVEAPPAKAEPAIRHPIDDTRARAGLAESGADQGRVPALSESDAIVREALSRVPGATGF